MDRLSFPTQALGISLSLTEGPGQVTHFFTFYRDLEHLVQLQDSSGSVWFSSLEKRTCFGTAKLSKISSPGMKKL